MSADVFTSKLLERALDLKAEGMSWSRIAARLGVTDEGLKRRLVPGFAGHRQALIREARHRREQGHARGQAGLRMPPEEVEAAMRTIPPDTRTLAARWMGDPLPGRSALDKKKAMAATERPRPYSPVTATRTYYLRGFLGTENLERASVRVIHANLGNTQSG